MTMHDWKPLTKEQIEEVYGPLLSYIFKTVSGKTLRVWYREDEKSRFSQKDETWMDFMYTLTVEEVKNG